MSEYIVETFGIVQDFADLHGDMNTPLYKAIMGVMASRQREEIVRCGDCKEFAFGNVECETVDWCDYWDAFVESPDGFCAWGERKVEQ